MGRRESVQRVGPNIEELGHVKHDEDSEEFILFAVGAGIALAAFKCNVKATRS